MYKFNGDEIKTHISEMTVGELEKALEILNSPNRLMIEKYLDIIEFLGASQDTLDLLTDDQLFEIINDFNSSRSGHESKPLPRTFTDNGITYEAFPVDGEFTLRAKQLAMLEKVLTLPSGWYSGILAVLFKRPEHSMKEHFEEVNVKKRIKLFQKEPADLYFGYVVKVSEAVVKNTQEGLEGA